MKFRHVMVLLAVAAVAAPVLALNPGTEIFVPAAARAEGTGGSYWVTDLYIYNPQDADANVIVYYLPRFTDNSSALNFNVTVPAGQTAVYQDVIYSGFGLDSGAGAFRLVSDQEIVVNCRIYNNATGATFGQGFEGVPASAAVTAGNSTQIVGITDNNDFRSNLFAVNTSSSQTSVTFHLVDLGGNELASRSYTLAPYAALYDTVQNLGGPSVDNAVLVAEVTEGSAIVVASKVDNGSGDPTTLEAWWACGTGSTGGSTIVPQGTYFGTAFDPEGYINGGIYFDMDSDSNVTAIAHWVGSKSDCYIIGGGGEFSEPVAFSEFANGVSYTNEYSCTNCGDVTWTVVMSWLEGGHENIAAGGTLDGNGSGWTGVDYMCLNGQFDQNTIFMGHAMPSSK